MNGNGSNDMFPQVIDMMNAEAAAAAAVAAALPALCCGGTRSRIGCEYHDPALQPAPVAKAPGTPIKAGHYPAAKAYTLPSRSATPLPAGARLLGQDDPEVLGAGTPPDMIYAVPGGGVMGVPQAASAATMTAEPAPLSKCECAGCYRMMWTDGVIVRCFDCSGFLP